MSRIRSGFRQVWPGLSIVALFGLLTIAFFWRIFFFSGIYFPAGGDFVSFNFPQNVFAAHSLQNGEIPLWNPFIMTGQPFAADPNIGFFYPLKLLLMLAVPGFTYQEMEYLLILHYFLSGLFTYALARDLGMTRSGGVVAGLGFMFSGFMIAQVEHPNIIITVTWLPLVFCFFRRAVLRGGAVDALCSGLFLAISIFGGHQQFSVLMVIWMLLWLAGYWLAVNRGAFWRGVRVLTLVFAVALAAAAVQILPALELIGQSLRGQLGADEATAINLPPLGWITLVLPHFFGPNGIQAESLWSGYGNWSEVYGYVGVMTIFLAAFGLALRGRGPEVLGRYEAWFLVGTALLGLLLAAGNATPLYGWAYTIIPILRFLRVPARFVYWFDTSLPLLAGFGFDFFAIAPTVGSRWRQVVIVLIALVLGGVALLRAAVPMTAHRAGDLNVLLLLITGLFIALLLHARLSNHLGLSVAFVAVLLALDLFAAHSTYNLTTHNPLPNFHLPSNLDPQSVGYLYRIDATPDALSAREPLSGLVHSVPTAFGLPWNPFDLTSFRDLWGEIDQESPAYDFASVKYLIAPRGAALSSKWIPLPTADAELQLFENTRVWPRASIVFRSIVEPDRGRALDLIRNNAFDPHETVLLDSGVPISRPAANANVQIVSSTNNSLVLETAASQDGYLVLSDAYYPGWRVWVDDQEQELLRANYAFRAVSLTAGRHTIRFQFDPLSWRIGLAISAIAWGAVVLGAVFYAATRIRRNRPDLS